MFVLVWLLRIVGQSLVKLQFREVRFAPESDTMPAKYEVLLLDQ
jgi:hypothetical protein